MEDTYRSGHEAVITVTPGSAQALAGLTSAAWRASAAADVTDLVDLAGRVSAAQCGLMPVTRPAELGPSPWAAMPAPDWRSFPAVDRAWRAVLEFAEQFTLDVSMVTDEQRASLGVQCGQATGAIVQGIYVGDFLPRAHAALDAVFGSSLWTAPALADTSDDFATAMQAFLAVVPGLQELDPIVTELVRLRGARQHRCRICQSLRSRSAIVAGATDNTFSAVDDYEVSALSPAHRAALAFTDAMIWNPGAIPAEVVSRLTQHWSPAQCVELILDITRNALNKIAVALAADAARVSDGVEIYDVLPTGEILYGLEVPV